MEPRPGWAVRWGGTAAPRAQPALCPCRARPSGCWPRLRAVRAGEAGAGRTQRPAEGLSLHQLQPLALSAAGRGQEPSGRARAPGAAVPGQPAGVPATGGHQVPGDGRAAPQGTQATAPAHLSGP
ncbi:translation initiation factor IF-2-like isoform X1 [Oenanthe melanoleuca]|uniref:translation initiation factor IF-2-like isoform X1 n=1 Tax=Oenanthe melanoleuca TaxID=2939378 RepID=UPI0024C163E9|nr:translation initiation factor IF-2-like isoform X1 [Oenanthe melanoleuca]